MSSNCFTVDVVQLQNSDGTRYAVIGLEDEESTLDFLDGEQRTIRSLKEKINSAFFTHEPRPLGRIKVYSNQHAAAASSQQWTHRQRNEALQEGTLYGFIDVFKIEQQQLGDGEWFVALV